MRDEGHDVCYAVCPLSAYKLAKKGIGISLVIPLGQKSPDAQSIHVLTSDTRKERSRLRRPIPGAWATHWQVSGNALDRWTWT